MRSNAGSARIAWFEAATIRRSAILFIVLASGFAGLGYEIVWTRMLSLALGTEIMAVLGVITGFFAGLALGAFVLDPARLRIEHGHQSSGAERSSLAARAVTGAPRFPQAVRT